MKITWEVSDGYAGGSRPHTTVIPDDELAEYEDEQDRENFIIDCIQEDFEQKVYWSEISRK